MSADNMAECPQCLKDGNENKDYWYGYSLSEYYEMGIRDGEFIVDYKANCSTCGLFFTHRYTERIHLR